MNYVYQRIVENVLKNSQFIDVGGGPKAWPNGKVVGVKSRG